MCGLKVLTPQSLPPAPPFSFSLSLSLYKISLPAKSSLLLQEGLGKGPGCGGGAWCLLSLRFPHPAPQVRTSLEPGLPTLRSRLAQGEDGLPRLQHHLSGRPHGRYRTRSRDPAPTAAVASPAGGSSAVSPTQPAPAPANLPAATVGVCAARGSHGADAAWLQPGVPQVFSWLVASSTFGKLQSQTAGPGGLSSTAIEL